MPSGGGSDFRRGHRLSTQPVCPLALAFGEGFSGFPCYQVLSGGWGLPRNKVTLASLMLSRFLFPIRASSLLFLVYQGRQASFRVLSFAHSLRLWQAFTTGIPCFSRARGGWVISAWGSDEVRCLQIVGFPFPRCLTTPLLTSLLAARVAFRRWLSPSQMGSPSRAPPPFSFRNRFPRTLPFSRFTDRWDSP